MARTKAMAGTKAGGKATRKTSVLRTTPVPKSGGVSKGSKRKASGGARNCACKRPVPKWQIPIGEFLTKGGSSKEAAAGAPPPKGEEIDMEGVEEVAPATSAAAACGSNVEDEAADASIDEAADTTIEEDEAAITSIVEEAADTSIVEEATDTSIVEEAADTSIVEEAADTSIVEEAADTSTKEEGAVNTSTKEEEAADTSTKEVGAADTTTKEDGAAFDTKGDEKSMNGDESNKDEDVKNEDSNEKEGVKRDVYENGEKSKKEEEEVQFLGVKLSGKTRILIEPREGWTASSVPNEEFLVDVPDARFADQDIEYL